MKHFTLFFLALIGFGFYTQAQSSINLNPTDPGAIFKSIKSISKPQRDSLLHVIDTLNIEVAPIGFDGPAGLGAELEKDLRGLMKDMLYGIRDYFKKDSSDETLAGRLFDTRIRMETFISRVNYEMNVKEMKDEFDQETYASDAEKAAAKKSLDEDIADEKKTMEEEIKSAKERGEADKQEFIKTLKAAKKA